LRYLGTDAECKEEDAECKADNEQEFGIVVPQPDENVGFAEEVECGA
jgi:hypothetical protein